MDILVSSNLERLVYFLVDDAKKVKEYYDALNETGVYKIDANDLDALKKEFYASWLSEEAVMNTVGECYKETGYVLDTHTAVGYGVYKEYVEKSNDYTKTIILSTASPYKFPQSVYKAITDEELDEYEAIDALYNKTNVEVPYPLKGIQDRTVRFKEVIDKTNIIDFIGQKIKEEGYEG